jgi:hypothetical protein
MSPQLKDKRLNILVTEQEQLMLQALAEDKAQTVSEFARQLIRRVYMERFGMGRPPLQELAAAQKRNQQRK